MSKLSENKFGIIAAILAVGGGLAVGVILPQIGNSLTVVIITLTILIAAIGLCWKQWGEPSPAQSVHSASNILDFNSLREAMSECGITIISTDALREMTQSGAYLNNAVQRKACAGDDWNERQEKLEADLRPLLTPAFLETLLLAIRSTWHSDFLALAVFLDWCHWVSGIDAPDEDDMIPLNPLGAQTDTGDD